MLKRMHNFTNNTLAFYGIKERVYIGDTTTPDNVPKIEFITYEKHKQSLELDIDKTWKKTKTWDKTSVYDNNDRGNDKIKIHCDVVENEYYSTSSVFEWILRIKEKTQHEAVYFTIVKDAGIEYHYQPAYTDIYEDGWSDEFQKNITVTATTVKDEDDNIILYRPEEICGSYAVYVDNQKLMHIPSPYFIDQNGQKVKANMHIQASWLVIDVPEQFADWQYSAENPLPLDPSFGYSTTGASYESGYENNAIGSKFTCPDNANIDQINAIVQARTASDQNIKCIITNSSKTILTNGISNASANLPYRSIQDTPCTYTNKPAVSASTEYYLFVIIESATTRVYYDSGSTNQGHYHTTNSYTSPTNPNGTDNNNKYSIYATYTTTSSAQVSHILGIATSAISHVKGIDKTTGFTKVLGLIV